MDQVDRGSMQCDSPRYNDPGFLPHTLHPFFGVYFTLSPTDSQLILSAIRYSPAVTVLVMPWRYLSNLGTFPAPSRLAEDLQTELQLLLQLQSQRSRGCAELWHCQYVFCTCIILIDIIYVNLELIYEPNPQILLFETYSMQSRSCPGPWDWQWSSLAEGMEGQVRSRVHFSKLGILYIFIYVHIWVYISIIYTRIEWQGKGTNTRIYYICREWRCT